MNVITRTITPGANLTAAANAPHGASALYVYGSATNTAPTFQLTPRLKGAFRFDDSAGTYTDVTGILSGPDTQIISLGSFEADVDFMYFGCDVPFRGVYFNVSLTNSNASVIAATYWNGAWTGLTETDGTDNGGATFGQDGVLSWTVPTDWIRSRVNTVGPYFWMRFSADATWDATVTLADAIPLGIQTNQMTAKKASDTIGWEIPFDVEDTGGLEATSDEASESVIITWVVPVKSTLFRAET